MLQTKPEQSPHKQRSILLVEDQQAVSRALRTLLEEHGFAVTAADTGLAALRLVCHTPPDAALIDVHLPDLNGLVLTAQLRQSLGPDVPLVVLSGDTSMETINSLPLVGATYFMPKPVRFSELLARLRDWLEPKGTAERGLPIAD